jgi:hypothetical protein
VTQNALLFQSLKTAKDRYGKDLGSQKPEHALVHSPQNRKQLNRESQIKHFKPATTKTQLGNTNG